MPNQLEEIRKACVAANPSILDLVFGCVVSVHSPEWGTSNEAGSSEYSPETWATGYVTHDEYLEVDRGEVGDILVKDIVEGYLDEDYEGLSCHILGRPITLADVLRAIKSKYTLYEKVPYITITYSGQFISDDEATHIYWNLLKDNLEEQSPEIISFLHSLLVGRE